MNQAACLTEDTNTDDWPPPAISESDADRSFLAFTRPVPRPMLHFTSGHFPPDTTSVPHSHPCLAIHGCLEGPIDFHVESKRFKLDAGEFFLLPAGTGHYWQNALRHTAATIGLLIDTKHPGHWPQSTGVVQCCASLETLVDRPIAIDVVGEPRLQHAFWQAADFLTAEHSVELIAGVGNLWHLVGLIVGKLRGLTPSVGESEVAQRIRRLLLTRMREPLTITEVALEVGVSPTRAKLLFRETFGTGIKSYHNRLKIWQAKRFLCDPRLTVEQVSRALGFSNPANFTRSFLASTNQTPTEFRSRAFAKKCGSSD